MVQRKFDRYMLVIGVGRNRKLVPLTDSEFRAHVAGVLALAAQAPIRGYFLIGEEEPTPEEVANEAGGKVTPKVAQSAIAKLKKRGVLEFDDDMGAWFVHDWWDVNPAPRKDETNAERQQRFRDRHGAGNAPGNGGRNAVTNASVTEDVTQTEGARMRASSSTSSSAVDFDSNSNDKSRSNPRRKRVDQSESPSLPDELAIKLPEVLRVLLSVWDVRGGIKPQERGVGMAMLRNPDADHLSIARQLEHWLLAGNGQRASTTDIAKRFGDWCEKAPAGKPLRAVPDSKPDYSIYDRAAGL